jgi:hypothetical protein
MNKFDLWFLQEIFEKHAGKEHVLDFSDHAFSEFFRSKLAVDIDDPRLSINGTSQGRRLSTFLQSESGSTVARALRAIWEYWDVIDGPFDWQDPEVRLQRESFFRIVRMAESLAGIVTHHIERLTQNETLDEFVSAIERDMREAKPAVVLDHLHKHCMSRFAHVLDQMAIPFDHNDPLHSRVERYITALEQDGHIHPTSLRVMRSFINIFDSLTTVVNNESLAKDTTLADKIEARLIFDSLVAILRFMNGFEASRLCQFEEKTQPQGPKVVCVSCPNGLADHQTVEPVKKQWGRDWVSPLNDHLPYSLSR